MEMLNTKSNLVLWFKEKIWSNNPMTPMPIGFREAYDEVFVDFKEKSEVNRLSFDRESRSGIPCIVLGGAL